MKASNKISQINGKRFAIRVSMVSWIDLLGYGRMISDVGFNPLLDEARKANQRLSDFHDCVARHSMRDFPTLVMNDGAVVFRDLSYRSASNTYDFLRRSHALFSEITAMETRAGFPGPRMVTAVGFRSLGSRRGIDSSTSQFSSILSRLKSGEISSETALFEARTIKRDFDIIPQLQSNYAFTKAYVAESSGKSGGFAGPNWFLDMSIFDKNFSANWITFKSTHHWKAEKLKLSGQFGLVESFIHRKRAEPHPPELRNAEEIACELSGNDKIISNLRKSSSTIRSSRPRKP